MNGAPASNEEQDMHPQDYEQGGVDRHRVLVGAAMLEVTTSWRTDRAGRHAVAVTGRLAHNGLGHHEASIELCDADGALLAGRTLVLQRNGFERPWWAEGREALAFGSGVAIVRFSLCDVASATRSPLRMTTPAGPSALAGLAALASPAEPATLTGLAGLGSVA